MKRYTVIALVLAAAAGAQANPIPFFDNFNTENGGAGQLNYTGFANWDVSDGTVDLIGNGYFPLLPAGLGLYIDMDGSTNNAGTITTKTDFNFAPGWYRLSFDMAGSQRTGYSADDTVDVNVALGALLDEHITLAANATLANYSYDFLVAPLATSGKLSFVGNGSDNVGLLLDNVSLVAIPAPGAALLAMLGLSIVGWIKRRLA